MDKSKVLSATHENVQNSLDKHHEVTKAALVNSSKSAPDEKKTQSAALASAAALAKKAADQHKEIAEHIAQTDSHDDSKKEAVKSSESVAKHSVKNHSEVTKSATETSSKDVSKVARASSKDVKKHAAEVHNESHGINLEKILIGVVSFLILMFVLYLIFFKSGFGDLLDILLGQ